MQDRQFRDMTRADRQALQMLGAAVRIGRERMGLSQDALAGNADLSQTAVSRLERGMVRGMAVVRFARVAWVLGQRMPLGGCPHDHRCAYDTEWRFARQRVLDQLAAGIEPPAQEDADGDDAPRPPSKWMDPVQPPPWWPGWGSAGPRLEAAGDGAGTSDARGMDPRSAPERR